MEIELSSLASNRERSTHAFNSTVSDRMSEFWEAIPELDRKKSPFILKTYVKVNRSNVWSYVRRDDQTA